VGQMADKLAAILNQSLSKNHPYACYQRKGNDDSYKNG